MFESNYPTYKVVKYPKAGETNPTMNLFVWNVGDDGTKEVIPPSEVSAWGEYIYTIADWTSSDVLRFILNSLFIKNKRSSKT